MDIQKLRSELFEEDSQWEWISVNNDDDPLCIRGFKRVVLDTPPVGYEWVEITNSSDGECRFELMPIEPAEWATGSKLQIGGNDIEEICQS
jgi:hypothetical protein